MIIFKIFRFFRFYFKLLCERNCIHQHLLVINQRRYPLSVPVQSSLSYFLSILILFPLQTVPPFCGEGLSHDLDWNLIPAWHMTSSQSLQPPSTTNHMKERYHIILALKRTNDIIIRQTKTNDKIITHEKTNDIMITQNRTNDIKCL